MTAPVFFELADFGSDNLRHQERSESKRFFQMLGFKVDSRSPALLVLNSTDCLAVTKESVSGAIRESNVLKAIELEEYLPVNAEDMVVGASCVLRRSDPLLIIVADRHRLECAISSIEANGHWIAGISCTLLLAAQELCNQRPGFTDFDLYWENRNQHWDVLRIRDRKPVEWQWLSSQQILSNLTSVEKQIGVIASEPRADESHRAFVPVFVYCESSSEVLPCLRENHGNIEHCGADSQIDFAKKSAQRIALGSLAPWVDFRRSGVTTNELLAPIRWPLVSMLAIVCAVLCALHISIWLQASQSKKRTSEVSLRVSNQFTKLYPGQRIPGDIVGRLRSEAKRLQTSASQLDDKPPMFSSMPVLIAFLNCLPEDGVFRIDHIRVASNQIVSIEGAVRRLSDSERLISSLRQAGFEFQPPTITSLSDGFTIRIEKIYSKQTSEQSMDSNKSGVSR